MRKQKGESPLELIGVFALSLVCIGWFILGIIGLSTYQEVKERDEFMDSVGYEWNYEKKSYIKSQPFNSIEQ